MVIDNGKKYEEAIKIHSEVVKTMDGVGYGLLKDGETFCRYGTDADGILFSMREAYEIHRFLLTSRETHLKERVRKEVEGMRKEYTPADMIWIGDEEQEVGEWKLVPKEGGLYCLSCGRFTPEEGCLCGWVSIDTLLDNLK